MLPGKAVATSHVNASTGVMMEAATCAVYICTAGIGTTSTETQYLRDVLLVIATLLALLDRLPAHCT